MYCLRLRVGYCRLDGLLRLEKRERLPGRGERGDGGNACLNLGNLCGDERQ